MVASAHLLVEAGSMVEMVVLIAEAFPGGGCLIPCTLRMDRGFSDAPGGHRMMLRGVSSPTGGRALGSLNRGAL
jgi:hypothetical protein